MDTEPGLNIPTSKYYDPDTACANIDLRCTASYIYI